MRDQESINLHVRAVEGNNQHLCKLLRLHSCTLNVSWMTSFSQRIWSDGEWPLNINVSMWARNVYKCFHHSFQSMLNVVNKCHWVILELFMWVSCSQDKIPLAMMIT